MLDEPTIGLHPRDTERLLANLRALVDTGSTVLVVEHDAETIRAADHLVDLGPGGGRNGGHIVAEGAPAEVLADPRLADRRARSREPLGVVRPRRADGATTGIELDRRARATTCKDVDLARPASGA